MKEILDNMFEEYLTSDCICMGMFPTFKSFVNNTYIHFGITTSELEDGSYPVYSHNGNYFMPKSELKKALDTIGV